MISIEIVGANEVVLNLGRISKRQHEAVRSAMQVIASKLYNEVQTLLNGGMLNRRSGKLANAQFASVDDSAREITVTLGYDHEAVPYGDILVQGVPHSWDISPKSKKALRFEIGGDMIFASKVTHPPLPARNFLAAALEKVMPEIVPTIEEALQRAE